jgi:Tfp pilus assembly protein PilN
MRAVNLIPGDARGTSHTSFGPSFAVLGLLVVALALVTYYVLTSNTISSRRAQLTAVQSQVSQAQSQVGLLGNYGSFVKLAQARAQTVRQIASGRFDWHAALSDLARVVPANTSLQSLLGTAAPGATVSGAGGATSASTASLRGNGTGPAFELRGCTKTQDDVARLISRMRLINGVQRVSLADATRTEGAVGAGASAPSSSTGGAASVGCGADAPTFDLVILFAPLPGATATATSAATGATATAAAKASGTGK